MLNNHTFLFVFCCPFESYKIKDLALHLISLDTLMLLIVDNRLSGSPYSGLAIHNQL